MKKSIFLIILVLGYMFFIYRTEMYIIETPSMEPIFKQDGVVLIDKRYDFNKLKVGDIIAYNNSYKVIIHRVMEIDNGTIKTRGDGNTQMDGSHATKDNYLGKYICNFTIPGRIIMFITSPAGIGVIIVLIILSYVLKKPFRKLRRMIKNRNKQVE